MNKYIEKIIQHIHLIRFRYHITFFVVILGAVISTNEPFCTLIKPLLITYFSFNILLYGGLYALNDIADIESDRKHPQKKNRPLPSGSISILSAYIFALTFIFLGLGIAFFYLGQNIFLIYLLFIVVNLIYTRIAKKIPYVEILFNGLTYPMRFFLGISLVTNKVPYLFLFAIFLLAFGIAVVRRVIEKRQPGWDARQVLRHYTEEKLIFIQIIAFIFIVITSVIDYPFYTIWYVVVAIIYFIFVFGIYFNTNFINFYKWIF